MLGNEKGLLGDESQSVQVGQVRLAIFQQMMWHKCLGGTNVTWEKCQAGQMSGGTNVMWEKCQVGQMSHFIIGGTNVTFYIQVAQMSHFMYRWDKRRIFSYRWDKRRVLLQVAQMSWWQWHKLRGGTFHSGKKVASSLETRQKHVTIKVQTET